VDHHRNAIDRESGVPRQRTRRVSRRARWLVLGSAALLVSGLAGIAAANSANAATGFEIQSLDGSNNNIAHKNWGQSGTPYSRVAAANYKDGKGARQMGPSARLISNRIFNDVSQNIFSERGVTQWGWTWGQFIDHNIGLARGGGGVVNAPYNRNDPLEVFDNSLGVIPVQRDAATPGTGTSTSNPRQQDNTISSYIDGDAVYSNSASRLEWLRDGSVDGNVTNNAATLMLPGGYLPRRDARGNASTAPNMAIDGRLIAQPTKAAVAGDVRANENIVLTATQTLFAREHNRIVGMLPNTLSAEDKFQIARRVVIAEIQFITYNEFLPAMGVNLPAYTGYKSNVNANLSNEFATVGYRGHSQIHGEIEVETDKTRYNQAQLDAFSAAGVKVEPGEEADEVTLAVPLNVAFFNPDLLQAIGEGPVMRAMGLEVQYKNDAIIDNELRSVLFQVPKQGHTTCLEPVDPDCYTSVQDLGALDVERGRDHGMPSYNALRRAYGLAPKTSFTAIVGSGSPETFPKDPKLTPGNEINDPDSLDWTKLVDANGVSIPLTDPRAQTDAVSGTRRTPLAARLKAIYGTVDKVDAFVGMQAEPHVAGSEMGELELAIWKKQFQALRDGDRFFFANVPALNDIKNRFGIDFHTTLSQLIVKDTDTPADDVAANVFVKGSAPAAAPASERIMSMGDNPAMGVDRVDGRLED
jgi:hypothetical protein